MMSNSLPNNVPPSDSSFAMQTQDHIDSTATEPSKQLRDVLFAALLLESGRVSERQLARATQDWSAFGHRSLADRAAEVSGGELNAAERTVAGQVLGTPLYMAPDDINSRIGLLLRNPVQMQ